MYYHFTSSASIHIFLDVKPSLKDVFKILRSKSAQWDEIGRQLDVQFDFRRSLHKDSSLSPEQRLETVINHWLETGNQNSVTWAGFIENLEELDYTAVVIKVKEFLQRKTKSEK